MVPCAVSISASESANIILRNGLGKIAANLRLLVEVGDSSATRLTVVDLFIDEGHRIGAYYLYKALVLVFYVCIPKHHALKIASAWLKRMNESEYATNTDKFDSAKFDVFGLLDENTRRRSEIRLLELVYTMSKMLSQFTQEINLFDKLLEMPILDPTRQAEATEMLASMPTIVEGAEEEEESQEGGGDSTRGSSIIDGDGDGAPAPPTRDNLRRMQSLDHVLDDDATSLASDQTRDEEERRFDEDFRKRFSFAPDAPLQATMRLLSKARVSSGAAARPVTVQKVLELLVDSQTEQQLNALQGGVMDSTRHRINQPLLSGEGGGVSFFHPLLWQKLGGLLVDGYKGEFEAKGDRQVPSDAAAYTEALRALARAPGDGVILDTAEFLNVRPLFNQAERAALKAATNPKHVAFDFVRDVVREYLPQESHSRGEHEPRLMAIYAARANPTKWQAWTKPNHRRVVRAGVWICKQPRRVPPLPPTASAYERAERRARVAEAYWASRQKIGLLLHNERLAHFFHDDDEEDDMPDPQDVRPARLAAFLACSTIAHSMRRRTSEPRMAKTGLKRKGKAPPMQIHGGMAIQKTDAIALSG